MSAGEGEALTHAGSVHVAATPDEVYALVSDVTRTGEWSPICTGCWWDEDGDVAPGEVGSWFTGRNEIPTRTWKTRSQVVAAEPGREFAFLVGGLWVRWGFTLEPADGGTTLTESWDFLPEGLAMFAERYGEDAQREIDLRTEQAHAGIPATLAAIKEIAER